MARGELLRKLFLSHKRGDSNEFNAIALEIISDEQKKKNYLLAKELIRILEVDFPVNSKTNNDLPFQQIPKDRIKQSLLMDVRTSNRLFSEITLTDENCRIINRIIEENRKSTLLDVHNIPPKRKLLFFGPPGCGKSLCAEVLASELNIPILYTHFDAIVSSYLGETASNLRKVFDHASQGKWILLFDEFDAIGKARSDSNEHGELKRVVNSLLQLIDNFRSESLIIATTNHEQMLDIAIWRRFDEVVYFPKPTDSQIQKYVGQKLKNFPHYSFSTNQIAKKLAGMSYSDIENICLDAIKTCILEDIESINEEIFNKAIKNQIRRLRLVSTASNKNKIKS